MQLYELGVKQNEAGLLLEASVYLSDAIFEYLRYADAYYKEE